MTRAQYNQANDYISQIEICEKVIEETERAAATNSAGIDLRCKGGVTVASISIKDAALVEGLVEYIKTWYTNRKTELETLLEKI
jgi:hypothetical protein